ncbi:acyltransferase family protein [Streptomyces hainanensis]|uniref:Acyltransferase n=1 Tax=Streptomyces hainanensis TaxID=402648 RepID=A0A4R4TEM8_9ACTN|nr:acyltransferase family protein [Streptomyces hainanensis]TDC73612.1 acyltransferase [Streptomyces hainanensis]
MRRDTSAETPAGISGEPPHRPDIQGLRAVAVGLVVLSHAGVRGLDGGYVGVDVFFVISGFLITSLLLRELDATGRLSFARFYARRAMRLLPAATLVVLVTLVGARVYLSKLRFEEYIGDALGGLLYAENIRLATTGTDYLSEGTPPSPFQHFWSLAVEEQFYLLWPLLLFLGWRAARGHRARVAALTAALCLVSFGLSVTVTGSSPSWGYFGTHTRFWELGAGALLALGVGRLNRLPARLAAPMTWLGLGCVLLAAVRFDDATPYPGHFALLPVLGTALVLAGGCSPARGDARLLLALRPATWLGGVSYGWYLWHWPLLVIGPTALGRADDEGTTLPLLLGAVALLLAWGTLHLVENPPRLHVGLRRRPRRALGVGFGLSASATAVILVASAFPPPISSDSPAPALGEALADAADPRAELTRLLAASGDGLPSNLTPALDRIREARSALYRDGCHVEDDSARTPHCVYGDADSERVVVLFGDSHAAQWFPALDRLARENGWKLVTLTKASCKVPTVTTIRDHRAYEGCDTWRSETLTWIRELRPELVIASSSEEGDLARPTDDPLREWADGYRATFAALADSGARLALLLDTVWPVGDPVECAAERPLELGDCANRLPGAVRDQARRDAATEVAETMGVPVIDPVPWLCADTGECPVAVGDTFVYRDDNHLSEAYAAALAPLLGGRIAELWPGA